MSIFKIKTLSILLMFALGSRTTSTKRDYRFIEIPASINKDVGKLLTKVETTYDIDQAIFALTNAYSGSQFLPKKEFKNLIESIQSIQGPISSLDLCKRIDSFMDVVSDNHLSAKFNNKPCIDDTHNYQGNVGSNFYKAVNDVPWQAKLSKKKNKTALLISITGFPKATNPLWNGFIEKVKELVPKSQFVVIDMRGNGGGDDSKGFELSATLAGTYIKRPYGEQWNSYKPESYQLFVNTFEYWARIRRDEGKEVPSYIAQLKSDFIQKRDRALKGERPSLAGGEEPPGEDFIFAKSIQKPIYILIDHGCASSCESTTDYFEFNPLAKTVGENTAGYIHFGNNGNVFLKNSGINLQMAVSFNSYLDGRFIEKKGITPEIPVPKGKDAMDFAWSDFLSSAKK